ncbi:ATP-binding cassette domain-containing protein, partial [Candidatus Kryptonium thompsonii]|uniref:ATP-binding cassette domain-containing protein n=1 Tax=Candidatus Kryptonium thompsonii TaxID=1633631 RepID=UPI0011476218
MKKYFYVWGKVIKAVDGVDISINGGEIYALIGESGSGKSTLGKLILKLLEPDEGEIFFDGVNITNFTKEMMRPFRRKMQMIFQDPYTTFNPIYKIGTQIFEVVKFHKVVESSMVEDYVVQLMRILTLHPDILRKYPFLLSLYSLFPTFLLLLSLSLFFYPLTLLFSLPLHLSSLSFLSLLDPSFEKFS